MEMKRILFSVAVIVAAASAEAQWNVVALTPHGFAVSHAQSGASGIQCGYVVGSEVHAALWRGVPGSFVDLSPPSCSYSAAQCVNGGVEGGFANIGGHYHAAIWQGTADSYVDLSPAAWPDSIINGLWGGQQVGTVFDATRTEAGLWQGGPESFVNLHPAGADLSEAYCVSSGTQGGVVRWVPDGSGHAAIWHGSAGSVVDLNPANALDSTVYALSPDRQFGYASFEGHEHAGYWTGAADTFVDLNPSYVMDSICLGGNDQVQVGVVYDAGFKGHAAIWYGTASTYVDLGKFAHGYVDTYAWAVDGNEVVGVGRSVSTGNQVALRWIPQPKPIPSPTAHGR
ncbi:MAG TPA: hypothetical protein VHE55_15110 [Fimbriimonadaceae bacterium]|nr:hypothetical protein [Fimbriimonadaceae bacterium]